MSYTIEDMEIDIEWLIGHGINNKEAKQFILHIVKHARIRCAGIELEQDMRLSD